MVCPGDALQHRADEEGRAHVAPSSAIALELVSRPRGDFGRCRGGLQQQSETDHEKSVRLSILSLRGNRPVPYVGSATGTGSYPQILLKTPAFLHEHSLEPLLQPRSHEEHEEHQ